MSLADDAQKAASNPESSVWVSAHAGSGKTTVLSRRVIRLLLRGTPPGAILCLTYTRAAAAEMANRIYTTLAKWVTLTDNELTFEITKLDRSPSPELIEKARRLFAESLETPGGLKVQTIHAFAGAILRKFPLEASVPADFTELDPLNYAKIKENALKKTLNTKNLTQAFEKLAIFGGDTVLDDLFDTILEKSTLFKRFYLDNNEDLDRVYAMLCKNLGTKRTLSEIEASIFGEAAFSENELKDWITKLSVYTENAEKEVVRKWTKFITSENHHDYMSAFFTKDYKGLRETVIRKPVAKKFPELHDIIEEEKERLLLLREEIKAAKSRDMTFTIMQVAITLIDHFESEKRAGAFLDFSDLIDYTAKLLNSGAASWVNYKLDQGIDHILVDEAQDTSPDQWEIIKSLAEEFTGGMSARALKRTLFVVGDEKQSIYSFQGADPAKFDEMRGNFAKKFSEGGGEFQKIPLNTSFRSAPAILNFVDEIAALPDVKAGLMPHDESEPHIAFHQFQGVVELWDLEKMPIADELDWRKPVDKAQSNIATLAKKIALTIQKYLSEGMRPGDILVLMKKRGDLFHAVNKALKIYAIPTAGSDRLILRQSLAVADLLNLAESLLNPYDDYALAVLLRSPLFCVSEEELYALSHPREASLYEALGSSDLSRFNQMQAHIHRSPFEFYATILINLGARAAFIARFGREVEDILDSFMASLQAFEANNLPDLRQFIAVMRENNDSLKRDLDAKRDEVRVMTVHGSKGLEAPIVFLCDITASAKGGGAKRLFTIDGDKPYPLWSSKMADDPALITEARAAELQAQINEYQRLLYVALTRAEKKLVLCGVERKKESQKNWHDEISGLMAHFATDTVPHPLGEGMIKRFYHGKPDENAITPVNKAQLSAPHFNLPPFDKRKEPVIEARREVSEFEKIGTLLHQLLQILPDMPHEKHADLITRMVGEAYIAPLQKLFQQPDFMALLTHKALTEVPIAGVWQGEMIERRVDRLCFFGNKLIIIDYKTGAQNRVTAGIIEQMRCYKALLSKGFPDFEIEAKVVFITSGIVTTV